MLPPGASIFHKHMSSLEKDKSQGEHLDALNDSRCLEERVSLIFLQIPLKMFNENVSKFGEKVKTGNKAVLV